MLWAYGTTAARAARRGRAKKAVLDAELINRGSIKVAYTRVSPNWPSAFCSVPMAGPRSSGRLTFHRPASLH
jgi:hypothetical protein